MKAVATQQHFPPEGLFGFTASGSAGGGLAATGRRASRGRGAHDCFLRRPEPDGAHLAFKQQFGAVAKGYKSNNCKRAPAPSLDAQRGSSPHPSGAQLPIHRHRRCLREGRSMGATSRDQGSGDSLQGPGARGSTATAVGSPAVTPLLSTALFPVPAASIQCLRTAGCFPSPGPCLVLICNCKQLFIIAHLQPLLPPRPPSAAPHCPRLEMLTVINGWQSNYTH